MIEFKTVLKKDSFYLSYSENLSYNSDEKANYILDFDGFAVDITPSECLTVTDRLHGFISDEYFNTIKEPVKNIMRNKVG